MLTIFHRFIFYILGGVFTEVLFTAIYNIWYHANFLLQGSTQLWVIPLYGFGGLWFEYIILLFQHKCVYTRLLIYVLNIYTIEYISGLFYIYLLTECPWYYDTYWSLHGIINLAYFPCWCLFAYTVEKTIFYLKSI